MLWWLWVVLGMGLLVVEMATPGGLFALFFGLSAIVVGVLTALGWSGPEWVQWLMFSVLSVGALLVLRGPLQGRLNVKVNREPVDSFVNELATVTDDIPADGMGKVELRGAAWTARSTQRLDKGQRCRVEWVEGLTLWVRPE